MRAWVSGKDTTVDIAEWWTDAGHRASQVLTIARTVASLGAGLLFRTPCPSLPISISIVSRYVPVIVQWLTEPHSRISRIMIP